MLWQSGVKMVDLSHCAALTTVGSYFLACCDALESVRLPPSVVNIGDYMLSSSGVKTVDLSHCSALTTVGSYFLAFLPRRWTCRTARRSTVGSYFLGLLPCRGRPAPPPERGEHW
eukprot:TRINITY_DN1113_c0_g1_i5.p2 TRINITY_DN1113_c0_g1~~TRINITY_DN1113_c0_g1_i5.p2  ORF type:complete len:115 (+),score=9.16 TRINITY_DN1113_c0_g1_i5:226-570(+)